MISAFLKAKHWQLFLLIFALPVIIYIGWLAGFISDLLSEGHYGTDYLPPEFFSSIITLILLMIIPVFIQYAWFWSMAVGLHNKVPKEARMNLNLFKLFFIIPLVFFILYMFLFVTILGSVEDLEHLEYFEDIDHLGPFLFGFLFFLFFSFFVIFCTFYQYWFIAKTIRTVELQRDVTFGEFVGEFFLVWFYPIGVWILQPRVNQLIEGKIQQKLE